MSRNYFFGFCFISIKMVYYIMVRVKGISVGSHIYWSPLEIIVFSSTLYHSLNEGNSTQFMYLHT